jgi:hypothetical protein
MVSGHSLRAETVYRRDGYLKLAPTFFEPGTPSGKIGYADDGGAYEKNDGQKI